MTQAVANTNIHSADTRSAWIDPSQDNSQFHIDGTSPSAVLIALFDMGEQLAQINRQSSIVSQGNELQMMDYVVQQTQSNVNHKWDSGICSSVGEGAGAVFALGVAGVANRRFDCSVDSALSVGNSISGATSSSLSIGANVYNKDAGLEGAASQAGGTYEQLDGSWRDSSSSLASAIMLKIQSVNDALATSGIQSFQSIASAF
jgi:hypothetical protein